MYNNYTISLIPRQVFLRLDMLETIYMRLDKAVGLLHAKNAKLHDIGLLARSIQRYGFQDPPKLNASSPNVSGTDEGAFIYGNGRVEALGWLFNQGEARPPGIDQDKDGVWLLPVKVGLNLSEGEAEAFLHDHNNLTLAGSDFTALDMAKLWGEGYVEGLVGLAEEGVHPETVDGDALDFLFNLKSDNKQPILNQKKRFVALSVGGSLKNDR